MLSHIKIQSVLLALSLSFIAVHCTNLEESQPPSSTRSTNQPSQESWNSKIVLSESGKLAAVIRAGHIQIYEEKEIIKAEGDLRIDFYNRDNGSHASTMTAERGEVNQNNKNLSASGNVRVVADDGVKLETDELRWDNNRQKILADGFVKMVTKNGIEQGVGFESDSNLKHWIMRNVRGRTTEKFELSE